MTYDNRTARLMVIDFERSSSLSYLSHSLRLAANKLTLRRLVVVHAAARCVACKNTTPLTGVTDL
jgi:hypothetical protein